MDSNLTFFSPRVEVQLGYCGDQARRQQWRPLWEQPQVLALAGAGAAGVVVPGLPGLPDAAAAGVAVGPDAGRELVVAVVHQEDEVADQVAGQLQTAL